MFYVSKDRDEKGSYCNPQSTPFAGCIPLDEKQIEIFLQYNGFVTITETEDGVTVEPNTEAWEAWKAAQPAEAEAPPTEAEQLRADVDYIAAMTGVNLV